MNHDSTPLPRIPRGADEPDPAQVRARHALCERVAQSPLPHLAGQPVPEAQARGNIENLIGFAQVPVGIAGPLRVDGAEGTYEVYVPLATTEGAMVASYGRGMRLACDEGAAIRARILSDGLSQHPLLCYESVDAAREAAALLPGWREELAALVSGQTNHGRLTSVEATVLGRRLLLRLVFTTGDAIGINMAARASDTIARLVAERTGATARYVHGQDVEKRANARALVEGRGRSVVAEAVVTRETLARIARVTPEEMIAIARSYAVGYAQLGTQNWLVQAANGLAALMLACGQDVAYVTESATGHLDLDCTEEGDLYVSALLPSLLLGTVGGGSGQGTARECLQLLGCAGAGKVGRLCEIAAATVLAGDLSLMAAFCSHEFVAAHEGLGRNRPEGTAD